MFQIRKGYDSESKTFRLPVELIEKLNILATQNKLSLNQLVIQCLNYAVDNLKPDAEYQTMSDKSGN
ncbi:MAG: toxin-antitoxin system HicB family antitoxin [Defluviitaleaceae bacterium]|nr:toxin-antitoxin system HicB family antitoxin [Defluviitaleaceae bacterium]